MKHVRRNVFLGLAALFALPVLPVQEKFLNQVVSWIPTEFDVELGDAVVYVMRSDQRFRASRRLQPGLAQVGQSIKGALAQGFSGVGFEQFELKVVAIESDDLNAFAVPGGRIFVSDSLLEILTRDELRAIVGHEYGHVLLRHGVKRIIQPVVFTLFLRAAFLPDADKDGAQESVGKEIAGMLREKFLGTDGKQKAEFDPKKTLQADELVGELRRAATLLNTLQYSRAMELEADQVGEAACRAGACAPGSLADALEKIDAARPRLIRWVEDTVPRYMATHPPLEVRLENMEQVRIPAALGALGDA